VCRISLRTKDTVPDFYNSAYKLMMATLRKSKHVAVTRKNILLLLLLLLFTAIDFSLGGRSPYTSTDKTNKNKYT
jgi:hypothetical protein